MKNVEQADIITQICQGRRAPPLSALQNCLYHLHTHRYGDMNELLHGRRMIYKASHPNDGTFCGVSSYRMKLMRHNDVVTGAYVARGARDMPDFTSKWLTVVLSGLTEPEEDEVDWEAPSYLLTPRRLQGGPGVLHREGNYQQGGKENNCCSFWSP